MRVSDIFTQVNAPKVNLEDKIRTIILEMTSKRLGATAVINPDNSVAGIITDGDLRRMLQRNDSVDNVTAKDIMSVNPKSIEKKELAILAFNKMESHKITQLIVTDGGKYAGMIHLHDILKEGIV